MNNSHDSHGLLVIENRVIRLLAELPVGWPATIVESRISLGDRVAVIRVGPANALSLCPVPISNRDAEVLNVVRNETIRLGRRVTGAEVRTALKVAGAVWCASTVNTTLAELVANGLLVNFKDRLGYGMAGGGGEE